MAVRPEQIDKIALAQSAKTADLTTSEGRVGTRVRGTGDRGPRVEVPGWGVGVVNSAR